jgi:flagellar hook-associated protein 2
MYVEGNGIHFDGLQSKLETDNIIKAMAQYREKPIQQLSHINDVLYEHKNTYLGISTQLSALDNLIQEHQSISGLIKKNISVSDTQIITAAVSSPAEEGTYSIEVKKLALAQKNYSNGFSSADEKGLLGEGTLSIVAPDGIQYQIEINDDISLLDVAETINHLDIGLRVGVIQSEIGQYRLTMNADKTGEENTYLIEESGSQIGLGETENIAQTAQDAEIILDNVLTLSRPNNTISDVIDGVTLQLHRISDNPIQVAINLDSTAIGQSIAALVQSTNQLIEKISQATTFEGTVNEKKMVGDALLNNLSNKIQSIILKSYESEGHMPMNLAELGIKIEKDGKLHFDENIFQEQLHKDLKLVKNFFLDTNKGLYQSMRKLTKDYTFYSVGILDQAAKSIDNTISFNQKEISKLEEDKTNYMAMVREKFNKMEESLGRISQRGREVESFIQNMTHFRG